MTFTRLLDLITEGHAVRSYSCLMLNLNFLYEEYLKLHENICECDVYDVEAGHGLEKEPHITVKYGLHTDKASDILSEIKFKPIKFKFKNISLFQNEKFDVLKFDVNSPDIFALNSLVCDKFENTDSFPNYHPHSTIAYLMPGTGKKYVNMKTALIGKEFTSNKFIFSSKSGDYTNISAI